MILPVLLTPSLLDDDTVIEFFTPALAARLGTRIAEIEQEMRVLDFIPIHSYKTPSFRLYFEFAQPLRVHSADRDPHRGGSDHPDRPAVGVPRPPGLHQAFVRCAVLRRRGPDAGRPGPHRGGVLDVPRQHASHRLLLDHHRPHVRAARPEPGQRRARPDRGPRARGTRRGLHQVAPALLRRYPHRGRWRKPAAWASEAHRARLAERDHHWPTLGEQYQIRTVLAEGLARAGYREHPTMYFHRRVYPPERWKSIMVDQDKQEAEVVGLGGSSSCRRSETMTEVAPAEYTRMLEAGVLPLASATRLGDQAMESRAIKMALSTCQPLSDDLHANASLAARCSTRPGHRRSPTCNAVG